MFEALADDMVAFAQAVAKDFLQLLDTLLGQIVGWLEEPVDIPFVSALYHALTGDQLTILDLICLLAAVPGTILLDVITGSPAVPDTVAAGPEGLSGTDGLASAASNAGQILLGITSFLIGIVSQALDILLLSIYTMWSDAQSQTPKLDAFLNGIDFAADFTSWAIGVAAAYGWATWEAQDWFYWAIQSIPQAANFAYLFRDDGTNYKQAGRDTLFGVATLILSAVYAVMWPASYRDAPKAPGLVLSSNIFSSMSSICEVPLALMPSPTPYNAGDTVLAYDLPIKAALYLIGAILGFAANVLDLVD